MNITEVRVKISDGTTRMKGRATVTLDNCFVIRDIRIISGENGLFVAMPSRKTPTGEYMDVAHPINSECRKVFTDAVLAEYEKELNI